MHSPQFALFSIVQVHLIRGGSRWSPRPLAKANALRQQHVPQTRSYGQKLGRAWGPAPDFAPGSESDPTRPPPGSEKFVPAFEGDQRKKYASTYLFMILSGLGLAGFNYYYLTYLHEPSPIFTDARYIKFELLDKQRVSHDSYLMTFKHELGKGGLLTTGHGVELLLDWPVCSHISVKNSDMQIQRPYTPVSVGPGKFQLLVKRYSDGFMTPWLVSRKVGEKVEMRGPIISFFYASNMKDSITMVLAFELCSTTNSQRLQVGPELRQCGSLFNESCRIQRMQPN